MLANFFEKTKPINSIVVGLVFCLLFLVNVFLSEYSGFTGGAFVSGAFFSFMNFLFVLFSGVVIIENKISNNNLFAPLILVLLYALFPKTLVYNNTIYILILFVFLYRRFSMLSDKHNNIGKLFDSGLIIGLLFLLFNWSILYILLVYMALILFQKLTFRKLITPLIGCIVPIIFYYVYAFATDSLLVFYEKFEFKSIGFNATFYNNHQIQIIALSILIVLSIFIKFPRMLLVSTVEKQHYSITLFSLVIGCLLVGFSQPNNEAGILFVFIPIAIIVGQLIELISKTWLKNLVLICFIALSLFELFTQ